jgi:cytoskeletal protein CcmA (bactofilin family)
VANRTNLAFADERGRIDEAVLICLGKLARAVAISERRSRGMFGKKDGIKEFEQMRQALKPAERYAIRSDSENASIGEGQKVATANAAPEVSMAPALGLDIDERSSVVSFGSCWQGNLKIDGSVRIDGQVSGEVDARETVYVAESAKVNAKIRAARVIIAGEIEGEVNCSDRLEVMPTGRVRAELTTRTLTVFEGAFIEGQIHMTRPEAAATPATPNNRDVALKLIPDKNDKTPKLATPPLATTASDRI